MLHRGGNLLPQDGQQLIDGIHHLDGVGPRLALDGQDDGPGVLIPGGDLVVFDAVDHPAQLLQAHGLAAPVGHDQGPIRRRGEELPGGLHREGLVGAVQGAGGQVDVGVLDRLSHLIDAETPAGQALGVQLDAHRIFLRPEDLDLGHAVHHGDALGHEGFAVFIHRGQGQGVRVQGQVEDRLVGGIDLLIGGRGGQLRGQLRSPPWRWPPGRPARRRRCSGSD